MKCFPTAIHQYAKLKRNYSLRLNNLRTDSGNSTYTRTSYEFLVISASEFVLVASGAQL
jgi:hypothetical protein